MAGERPYESLRARVALPQVLFIGQDTILAAQISAGLEGVSELRHWDEQMVAGLPVAVSSSDAVLIDLKTAEDLLALDSWRHQGPVLLGLARTMFKADESRTREVLSISEIGVAGIISGSKA